MKSPVSRTSPGLLSVARVCVLGVAGTIAILGQNTALLNAPGEPIPNSPYKTWSLFLINNPQWLVAESSKKVMNLYDEFEAFGKAIGPDHVAVWFWKKNVSGSLDYRAVDVDRAAVFCAELKLPPSKGPYILVTNEYPGAGQIDNQSTFLPTPLKSYYTVSLNNKSADEIMQLLTHLADKITADRLAELNSSSEGYWRAWQRAFEGIRGFLSSRQMTVSIKTPLAELQIK